MIDNLTVAKSAAFFTIRKHLTDKAVEDLFTALRKSHGTTANNVFRHIREIQGDARWSAVCFEYETPPAFLDPASGVKERLFGYLLLVDIKDTRRCFPRASVCRQHSSRGTLRQSR